MRHIDKMNVCVSFFCFHSLVVDIKKKILFEFAASATQTVAMFAVSFFLNACRRRFFKEFSCVSGLMHPE